MAKQNGAKIKEARLAAGLTQADVAKKVEGLSAQDLSKAERGQLDLTQKQIQAIAKLTGVSASSLTKTSSAAKSGAKTSSAAKSGAKTSSSRKTGTTSSSTALKLTAEEKKLIGLYRAADKETKKAATALLKGEQQDASLMDTMMSMLGSMMGGSTKEESKGDPKAEMMNLFGSMMGGSAKTESDDDPKSGMMSILGDLLGGKK